MGQTEVAKKSSVETLPKANKAELTQIVSTTVATFKEKAAKEGSAKVLLAANASAHLMKAQVKTPPKGLAKAKTPIKKESNNSNATKKVTIKNITLKKVPFEQLPGWNESGVKQSLIAFQRSCKVFLKTKPSRPVGSQLIKLKAQDWLPACNQALTISNISEENAKAFFEKWFYPLELVKHKPVKGLFTGYYMPLVKGNLTRTKKYNTPIYGLPTHLKWSSYNRRSIDKGILQKKAPVIAWIHSPVDRLFLETEGSGVIKLTSGKKLYLGYAGENGAHYTSISSLLIKRGVMTKHTASKQAIQRYFSHHPSKMDSFLQQNKSFVFFENLKKPAAIGAHDIALTPGYSLAIDKRWIPLGSPLWLSTKKPHIQDNKLKRFHRLMIAQDTGGAIRGLVRGDVYWGAGKKASFLGENMKNEGRYWLFLPKHIFDRLTGSINKVF
ncbi:MULTISPECIES: murein transglycosylase A [Legionella]|uniref:Membrane-bound lytic murein transglycosylase A n=1 Tax=Legionella maceachernii TaxID=466 RepID=A0A0W0WHZ7_9GAMM|nr:MltA domain-containing protein [Legionella maceachernii]KTD31977.1 membrane-bound lytic murein transglycosylase (MltA) family protein [Legionella maceachernii]SKA24245.1 membrane-bound lytic murein transglycosylase A [Legionella maceachernii]SUP04260.1 Membrane-bound lytic murein transglycosylase A precursor [Legionella maceachernii]